MHTEPKDHHGQDLGHIVEHLGLTSQRQVLFSTQKSWTRGTRSIV